LLLPFVNKAQVLTTKKNGGEKQSCYFFVSAGVSLPQGYRTQDGIRDVKALSGPIVSVGYQYFFNKRWGMGLVTSAGVYKSEPVHTIDFNRYSSRTNENWQKAQLYVSASYTPIIRKRWAVDLVHSFGLYYMREPAYEYSVYNGPYQSVPARKDWQDALNIGIKMRILLKDNIALQLGANYFYEWNTRKNVPLGFQAGDFQLGVVMSLK